MNLSPVAPADAPTPPDSPGQPPGGSPAGATAAQRTIAVIGDAWTLRILRSMFRGRRRHGEFIADLGVSRAVLGDRLSKLVAHGVLQRRVVAGGHPQYRLSARGLDLWSLFVAMWLWETDWGTGRQAGSWPPDLPREPMVHLGCGQAMRPVLRCQHCRGEVQPFDTRDDADPVTSALPADGPAFRRTRGGGTPEGASAPVLRLARVVGDRWNAALVAAAFRGVRQFARFQQTLQIGPAQLSERLGELQALGILRPRHYAANRQEYRLTRAGVALFPIVLEMVRWGRGDPQGAAQPLPVRHMTCGERLRVGWHCGHCAGLLQRADLRFV